MKRSVRIGVSTAAAAILSGLYWFVFFLFADVWTASGYRADVETTETFLTARVVLVFASGPAIFALPIVAWRRVERMVTGQENSQAGRHDTAGDTSIAPQRPARG